MSNDRLYLDYVLIICVWEKDQKTPTFYEEFVRFF